MVGKVESIEPDIPGRGMWTLKGGLLPEKSGGKGPGVYRVAVDDEQKIGSHYVLGDVSATTRTVNLAVKAFQSLCGMPFFMRDGILGAETGKEGVRLQKTLDITSDGIFGPETMKAALRGLIRSKSDMYALNRHVLFGLIESVSRFDLAAVGKSGWTYGLCQINIHPKEGSGGSIGIESALTPDIALDWTARNIGRVFAQTYMFTRGISRDAAFNVAVLNHRSPKEATALRDTGDYPNEQAKAFVESVRSFE
jgi:hypothetical protein